jgi:hypothetical protein
MLFLLTTPVEFSKGDPHGGVPQGRQTQAETDLDFQLTADARR